MKVNLWTKTVTGSLWLKNLKTPEDFSQFERLLKKLSIEAALNGMRKISSDPELTPATVIPQRPLSQATLHWNCILRAIVTEPSNHNW